MEQSPPWKTDSHSAINEIPRFLRNPKVHHRVHYSPPLVPVHNFQPYLPKIHSNIILPPTPRSSECSLIQVLQPKYCIHFSSPQMCYMSHPSHILWLDRPNNIWWSVQVMKPLIMQSFPASHPFVPLSSKYSPQDPVLKHPQSSLSVTDQVFTPTQNNG
jgi:hypothetical protein